ncbi:MAG: hypothetical protein A2Y18_08305 [Clostridiales bacterium GWD2_32_19]|nr:MAG: hypothetical protein A2Y18_08305 [Clostridiales bacterium GWD2_32_19]
MENILKNTFKSVVVILFICVYYLVTLSISAYIIKFCEKNFSQTIHQETNITITQVVNGEKIQNKSIISDISRDVKVVTDNQVNKYIYIFISTLVLVAIAFNIRKISYKKEDTNSLLEEKWLGLEDIRLLEERKIISQKEGIILGKYQSKGVSRILTITGIGLMNKHVIVVDSEGFKKSNAYVKTNILNMSKEFNSFVISDPKGEYLKDTACFLREKGYDIKILNLSNIKQSHRWNPLDCVVDGLDAHYMAEVIVEKLYRDNKNEICEDVKKTESELLKNMIIYIKENFDKKSQNITAIYHMLCTLKADDIDILFEQENSLIRMSEFEFYLNQPIEIKIAAINDLIDKLEVFDMKILSNMMKVSEIKIQMLKLRPCAYYIILPDTNEKLDLIATLFITQIFKEIGEIQESAKDELIRNREVYFMLDEFVEFGYIPKFADRLVRLKSRKINCSIIINSISSLKSIYNEVECTEMMNHSDTKIFYDCNDSQTALYFALGLSKSVNCSKRKVVAAKDLMNLEIEKCIVAIRGQKPMLLHKYDWTNLQKYKYGVHRTINEKLKRIKDILQNGLTRRVKVTEYIEPEINIYEPESKFAEKKNNVTYYNDYKNVPKIKLHDKPDDEYETEVWDNSMNEYDEKAE